MKERQGPPEHGQGDVGRVQGGDAGGVNEHLAMIFAAIFSIPVPILPANLHMCLHILKGSCFFLLAALQLIWPPKT